VIGSDFVSRFFWCAGGRMFVSFLFEVDRLDSPSAVREGCRDRRRRLRVRLGRSGTKLSNQDSKRVRFAGTRSRSRFSRGGLAVTASPAGVGSLAAAVCPPAIGGRDSETQALAVWLQRHRRAELALVRPDPMLIPRNVAPCDAQESPCRSVGDPSVVHRRWRWATTTHPRTPALSAAERFSERR
jgi:hypothetical protein